MLDNIKERPILFSGPMVRALLNGSKTQTRRVVKPQPEAKTGKWQQIDSHPKKSNEGKWLYTYPTDGPADYVSEEGPEAEGALVACPYGQPGERLWVRETWVNNPFFDGNHELAPEHLYRADGEATKAKIWKPSIFMPRAASRILLEIVSVRVERVKSISNSDAIAEGIEKEHSVIFGDSWKDYINPKSTVFAGAPSISFKTLWKSIHGPGANSWKANPWVWVVEFKVVEPAPAGCVNALDCGNDGACQCAAAKGKEVASE